MFRRRIIRQQKKAQLAFARKWMVTDADETDSAPMFARKWSVSLARMTAGVTAAFAATGGMAYAGVLPEPVQRAVSAFAADVGVELPSPDDTVDKVIVETEDEEVDDERADDPKKEGNFEERGGDPDEDAKGSGTSQAVHKVIDKKDEYEDGKDFGHAIADAAHAANAERKAQKAAAKAEKVTGPPEHASSVEKPVKENPTPPEKPETAPVEKERPEPARPEPAPQGNPNGGKNK